MKAISLIIGILLLQVVVGNAYRQPYYSQGRLMVNQDFIDEYPEEIAREDLAKTSSAEDKNSKSPYTPSNKDENLRTHSSESSQETNQVLEQSPYQDQKKTNEDQPQARYIAAATETKLSHAKQDTSRTTSEETLKQSIEETNKSESQSSESEYNEMKRNKLQRDQQKMSQFTQSQRERKLYTDRKPQNEQKYQRLDSEEMKVTPQDRNSNYRPYSRKSARSEADIKSSSAQYESSQPIQSDDDSLEVQGQESRPSELKSSAYQNSEIQRSEESSYEYKQPKMQSNKPSKTKMNKKQYKKNQYSKSYKHNKEATEDESRSEDFPKVQQDSLESHISEYKWSPMSRNKHERGRPSDHQSRIEYIMLPSLARPVSQMLRMDSFINTMKPIDSKWKKFYIPAATFESESAEEENKAKLRQVDEKFRKMIAQSNEKTKPNVSNPEFIKENKLAEEHTVHTDDGYILRVFRIPAYPATEGERAPVFLMHGLMGSADDWLLRGEDSLAYLLAKAGHDVWLGNVRGNKYAQRHVAKHPAQSSFWQFSNDEIALHDLPAMIDYALNVSKAEKMVYIGHSQAGGDFFALVSTRPEYNQKFIAMYALAPTVYMTRTRSPLAKMIAPSSVTFNAVQEQLKDGQFTSNNEILDWLRGAGGYACEKIIGSKMVCSNTRFIMSGVNMEQIDVNMVVLASYYLDGGASVQQVKQLGQAVDSDDYRMYDYGALMNSKVYGSPMPPAYELGRVTVPVQLYYGPEDWLVSAEDVARLQRELPNAQLHEMPGFTTMDFVLGTNAPAVLYKNLVDSMPSPKNNN